MSNELLITQFYDFYILQCTKCVGDYTQSISELCLALLRAVHHSKVSNTSFKILNNR